MNAEEKTVLIVDDDSEVWDLLYYIVRKEGFRTEKASDGEEALDKARSMSPSLILLDLMLPRLSGFELLRELQDGVTADIPIILVSGRHMDQSTLDLLKSERNVKDFMEKPVKPQALTARLHALLGTRPTGAKE
jgi:two-component system response regulator AdeR